MSSMQKRIIAVLVNNSSGVLSRLAGLFARRGFNIDSLTVGTTEDPSISRMTIVVHGDKQVSEQIMKQLHKQVDVLKVTDLTEDRVIVRELVLIKVSVNHQTRPEINHIVVPFRASILDVGKETVTIQATGDVDKIEALIELLKIYGIKEIARTGVTALARGHK